jgi:hypothetical protein
MTEDDRGTMRFSGGQYTWNYRSNFDWAGIAGVGSKLLPADKVEQLMFVCHAMNMTCTPPAPGPGTEPSRLSFAKTGLGKHQTK